MTWASSGREQTSPRHGYGPASPRRASLLAPGGATTFRNVTDDEGADRRARGGGGSRGRRIEAGVRARRVRDDRAKLRPAEPSAQPQHRPAVAQARARGAGLGT